MDFSSVPAPLRHWILHLLPHFSDMDFVFLFLTPMWLKFGYFSLHRSSVVFPKGDNGFGTGQSINSNSYFSVLASIMVKAFLGFSRIFLMSTWKKILEECMNIPMSMAQRNFVVGSPT